MFSFLNDREFQPMDRDFVDYMSAQKMSEAGISDVQANLDLSCCNTCVLEYTEIKIIVVSICLRGVQQADA